MDPLFDDLPLPNVSLPSGCSQTGVLRHHHRGQWRTPVWIRKKKSGPFQRGMEKNMIVEASTNHNKSHRHRLQHDWGSHRAQLLNMVLGRRWRSCLNRRFRCADAQNCGFRMSVWTTGQLVNFCWSNISHVNPTRSATEIRPSGRKGQVGPSNSSSSSLTNLLNHLHVKNHLQLASDIPNPLKKD